jgi:parallel beta-helix repeat protein
VKIIRRAIYPLIPLLLLSTAAAFAQTAAFPSRVATDADLKVLKDRAQTTLTAPLNASATSFTVVSGSKYAANVIVTIDSEQIAVCSVSGNTLTVGQSACPNVDGRGFGGTSAASHASGVLVSAYAVAWNWNAPNAEIKAMQTALGPNLANVSAGAAFRTSLYAFSVTSGAGVSSAGGTLSAGANTLTFVSLPLGVNPTDGAHYLYVSGGTGTAEPCLITGGSGNQIIVSCANTHSGGWSVATATGGWAEAVQAAGVNGAVDGGATQVTIYAPITVGYSNVTLRCAGCKLSGTPPDGSAHVIIAASRAVVDGLWLHNPDTNIAHQYDLVRLVTGATDATIKNNKFTGAAPSNAIQVNVAGAFGLAVQHNLIDGVGNGIICNFTAVDIYDVDIGDNTLRNLYGDGIELNIYTGGGYTTARNFRIHDNYISPSNGDPTDPASGFAIGISGPAKVSVTGNNLHNCRIQCVHIESGAAQTYGPLDVAIVGNQIDGTGTGATTSNDAIWAINCTYCTISGNVISGAHYGGLSLAYNGTEQSMSVAVIGNTIRGNTGPGIIANALSTRGDARWNIAHNVIVMNGGDGISLGGGTYNLNVSDNTIQGNTGYAARLDGTVAGVTWHDNDLSGNTAGDLNIVNPAGPLPIQNGKALFTANVPAAGDSAYTSTINLGVAARGWLTVRVYNQSAPTTAFVAKTYDLTWDGTTLCSAGTCTLVGTSAIGSSLSAIAYQMSGHVLQVRAHNVSGGDVTGVFDVQFNGTILR